MQITLNMLLTKLEDTFPQLSLQKYLSISSENITGIRLLPFHKETISKHYLYLCEANHPIHQDHWPEGLLLICVCPSGKIPCSHPDIIWIETDMEQALIFNSLQEIYNSFLNWHRAMHDVLIQESGLSELIRVSESVMENPLLIYDLSLKLLAYSENYASADFIFSQATKKGYLPSDIVSLFEQEQVFDILMKTGIYISETESNDRRKIMAKLFFSENKAIGYCIMLLITPKNEPYQQTIFENFYENAQISLLQFFHNKKTEGFMYEYLLLDLLENETPDDESLQERLNYIDLPFRSEFYLCLLKLCNPGSITIHFLLHQIQMVVPQARVFEYHDQILILIYHQTRLNIFHYEEQFPLLYSALLNELKQHEIICGISRPFFKITEIKAAFFQAQTAIRLKTKYSASPDKSSDIKNPSVQNLCFFEDCALTALYQASMQTSGYNILYSLKLEKILKDDYKNGTNYALILKTYLGNDCRATETAAILHMHRNNVIYHIRRMENRYHLNLDDVQEKLKLQLAFYCYLPALQ